MEKRYGYLSSLKPKKHQRRINSVVRSLNKNIENDSLWRGRFVVRQNCFKSIPYEDYSGLSVLVGMTFYDKKTGKTNIYWYQSIHFCGPAAGYQLWRDMNDFIVKYCDAWADDPRKDTIDYRTIKI